MPVGTFAERPTQFIWQSLFEVSSTQKHRLGTIRMLEDGRTFAYARAGAALTAGKITVSPAPEANHLNCTVAAAAIGAQSVTITLGATAAAANLYKDGYLHINDGVGLGQVYKIRGHAAISASGSGAIELYDKIRVALTTASRATLSRERQDSVIYHPAATAVLTNSPAGVPPVGVGSGQFFWNQVKGPCAVLIRGTVVQGNIVVVDATATTGVEGAVVAAADHAALIKGGSVGTVMRVNAGGHYALINLVIPGY